MNNTPGNLDEATFISELENFFNRLTCFLDEAKDYDDLFRILAVITASNDKPLPSKNTYEFDSFGREQLEYIELNSNFPAGLFLKVVFTNRGFYRIEIPSFLKEQFARINHLQITTSENVRTVVGENFEDIIVM